MNGWIKLHRNILKWEWYQNSEVVHLFLHLLLLANHEENKWQELTIKRGECATGRKSLSLALNMSEQKIRTNLDKLKSTNEITIKSTNKFSIITIVKWEQYQAKEYKATSKITKTLTNKQPTDNQQITTNKNDKNNKNVKKYSSSLMNEKDFISFYDQYPKKEGKKKALESFLKIKQKYLVKILKAIEIQKKSDQWKDKQYVPLPATWLNGERWEDEETEITMEEEARKLVKDYNGDGGQAMHKFLCSHTADDAKSLLHIFYKTN